MTNVVFPLTQVVDISFLASLGLLKRHPWTIIFCIIKPCDAG